MNGASELRTLAECINPAGVALLDSLLSARVSTLPAPRAAVSGTYGNNVSTLPDRQRRSDGRSRARAARYRLRDFLRWQTDRATLHKCGHVRIAPSVALVRRADGSAGLLGLARCRSVWACPCCAPGIAAERAKEVSELVAWGWRARRARTYMLSLTMRHAWSDLAAVTFRGLANAWRRFCGGRDYQAWKVEVGLVGFVRGVEATHGANGWHPHAHVLLVVRDPYALESSWQWLAERWQRCVELELGHAYAPDLEHGCDLRSANVADYIVKLGLELTSIGTKSAAAGNRTPWEIATDALGDARSVALWREYVEATHGRKQLTWSRGLRAAAGLKPEAELEAELEQAEAEGAQTLAELAPVLWDECRKRHMEPQLLDAAEHGLERVALVLAELRRLGGFPLPGPRDPGT